MYCAYLLKRARPEADIHLVEQNPAKATFGFGVVFSEQALGFLAKDDPVTSACITPHMEAWNDLTVVHRGTTIAIDGVGFTAIGRMKQLAGQFTRGLHGGALFRTALFHSHSVAEILDRISEYFETISAGRQNFGEAGSPGEIIEAPVLDSCEVSAVAS